MKRLSCVLPAAILSLLAWAPAACTVSVAAWALHEDVGVVEGARIFSRATLFGRHHPHARGARGHRLGRRDRSLRRGVHGPRALPIVALFRWTTTGFALSLGVVFLGIELLGRRRAAAASAAAHFDEIAVDYERQYSPRIAEAPARAKGGIVGFAPPAPPRGGGAGARLRLRPRPQCLAMRRAGLPRRGSRRLAPPVAEGARSGGARRRRRWPLPPVPRRELRLRLRDPESSITSRVPRPNRPRAARSPAC